jgi:DNA-binding NarL/FixJ family response regulator
MHDSTEHVHRALRAGAQAYLLKESTGWELVDAVRAVCAGKRYLSRRIDAAVLHGLDGDSPLESLSHRERQMLQLVAEGHSSAEIGRLLSLSPKTVDSYRSRLMQKLGLGDVPALVKFAIRFGLTRLE